MKNKEIYGQRDEGKQEKDQDVIEKRDGFRRLAAEKSCREISADETDETGYKIGGKEIEKAIIALKNDLDYI